MRKYKGIIFDLDGTLLNTIYDLADSVNEAMEKLGFPLHSEEAYKQKVGNGFNKLIERSLPENQRVEETIQKGLKLFVEAYDRRYLNKTVPYEGIDDLLKELPKKGIQIAINSNKRGDYTRALADKFFKDVPFVAVYGERKDVPKKPDPTAALEIAHLMELKPEEILYIGDSSTDMITGKNAEMDTVGVAWGFRGEEELRENGAVYIAETTKDILNLV